MIDQERMHGALLDRNEQWIVILVEGKKKTQAIRMIQLMLLCAECLVGTAPISEVLWTKLINLYNGM